MVLRCHGMYLGWSAYVSMTSQLIFLNLLQPSEHSNMSSFSQGGSVLTLQVVVQLLDIGFVIHRVTAVEGDFSSMRPNHQTCTQRNTSTVISQTLEMITDETKLPFFFLSVVVRK